ncbi:hypothetical protein CR152_29900 [Massilia violaceinigra]|uniref:Uncharacterized protein n=1 Tax=Massilia violaceinigra TaxID=2045208 RepID=A0A2D2DTG9_9BURK|nr:hypothetical protein [Massilia violaceinigra]ATQ78253.1 hypothetical protein CR152_29900 [Massilia violaceinigra]
MAKPEKPGSNEKDVSPSDTARPKRGAIPTPKAEIERAPRYVPGAIPVDEDLPDTRNATSDSNEEGSTND